MWTKDVSFSHLNKGTWCSLVALSVLVVPYAQARTLNPGETETLSPVSSIESWQIVAGSTLNVDIGATTQDITMEGGTLNTNGGFTAQIDANNDATVNLVGTTVAGTSGAISVNLINSVANISGSSISGLKYGLQAARDVDTQTGSTVDMQDSTVRGTTGGAVATSYSTLNVRNSVLEGTGVSSFGLSLYGGQASVSAGSKIIGGLNGVTFNLDNVDNQVGKLVINRSSVEGKSGAAIVADLDSNPLGPLIIDVLNGSSLKGGNGTILEVAGGASVAFTVENSVLQGNIKVETGSNADVALRNHAALTGDLENVTRLSLDTQSTFVGVFKGDPAGDASVTVNDGSVFHGNIVDVPEFTLNHSTWVMTGNNQVDKLTLNGGTVDFAQGASFNQLDVGKLSGNGTLAMATDFGTRQTSFLNVTDSAEGNYELSVTATGSKPTTDAPIQLVKVAGGEAQFALRGGAVDAGALTYKLFEEDNGWYLRPDAQVSISTQSVLAIANTAPTIIYAENTLLNTRMGDRRLTGGQPGVWTRTYGNRYSVKNAYADGYSQTQRGVVLGADARLGDSEWLLGGMFGYSNTKLDLRPGSSGTVDSYSLGAYLTKFDAKSGFYVDAVTKINRFDSNLDISMSDGVRTKGNYDNYGLSGSLEVGKQSDLGSGFFWAPFAQITAAVVSGEDYTLDNGLDVNSDLTRSVIAKAGAYVGNEIDMGNGHKLQPRVRVAMGHEFIKNNEVGVNGSRFDNDASATSIEMAAGLNWALPHGIQFFAEAGASQSKTVKQDYNISTGISLNF